jgi:hypothetical protein
VGHLGMSCKAREGALDDREGPTKRFECLTKVLGEEGVFPPWGREVERGAWVRSVS